MAMSFSLRRNRPRSTAALAALAAFFAALTASAELLTFPGPDGAQGFTNLGTASALPSADVNDATTFSVGKLITSKNSTGFFAGLPRQIFAPITFTVSDPLSLQFGNAEFGTFASQRILEMSNDPLVGSRCLWVEGLFTKGTFGGELVPNPAVTTFTISFNQNAGTGAAISVNATLDFNSIQPVPEPSALGLAAAALGTTALFGRRRRRVAAGRNSPAGLDAEAGTMQKQGAVVVDDRARG
jgi:hypothetical protein